jgi:hypothetical protein
MKKILYLLVALCLLSCQDKPLFTIEGTLPSHKYDGEWIYLVPMVGANHHTVDSVKVKNGAFTFKGDEEKMCILRMRPLLRLELQELLVVTEKGRIKVSIGTNSVGGGTPQNNALQVWKNQQLKYINTMVLANKMRQKKCSKLDSAIISSKIDSLHKAEMKESMKLSVALMKEQGDNTLGRFIYEQTAFSLSPEDKAKIEPIFKANK